MNKSKKKVKKNFFNKLKNIEIDTNFKNFCIKENCTIYDAMNVIEKGKERICFVINEKNKLLLVVSDGDIRRALLKGHNLSDQIKNIHNRKPIIADENKPKTFQSLMSKRLSLIPVVSIKNEIKGILRINVDSLIGNIRNKSVAIIGLGYVGLTLALTLAENGFDVVGLENNSSLVKKINKKISPFYENGLKNLLNKHVGNSFKATSNTENVFAEIYIITVGTPVKRHTKKPDINHLKKAVETVSNKLKLNDTVILRSTVPIGCTRKNVIPILEKNSGLKTGKDFFVAYCPERTAEGKALTELRELPQIVGGFDQNSRQVTMNFFNENTHTVIDVGSLEAAEMCKLLDNTYRDIIFGYSNQMALLSENLGLNLKELISKVNIGYGRNNIPFPSPGVGGPCLSKDPYILDYNFKKLGLNCQISLNARKVNEAAPELIYRRCNKLFQEYGKKIKDEKIFIIGFAFKGEPETSDFRDSTTIWFLDYLKSKGVKNIFGFDPVIDEKDLKSLGINTCSISDGFNNSGAVFLMNNHLSYSDIKINDLLLTMNKPAIFYDGWNMFQPQDFQNIPGVIYTGTGF